MLHNKSCTLGCPNIFVCMASSSLRVSPLGGPCIVHVVKQVSEALMNIYHRKKKKYLKYILLYIYALDWLTASHFKFLFWVSLLCPGSVHIRPCLDSGPRCLRTRSVSLRGFPHCDRFPPSVPSLL